VTTTGQGGKNVNVSQNGRFRERPEAAVRGGPGERFTMTAAEVRLPEYREARKGEEIVFTLRKRAEGELHYRGAPATPSDVEEGLAEVLAFAAELAGLPVPEYTLRPETLCDYHLDLAILQCVDEVRLLLSFVPKAVESAPKTVREKGVKIAKNALESAEAYLTTDIKRQKPPAFEAAILALLKFVTEVLTGVYGEHRLSSLRSAERQFWAEFTIPRC
jgi:hypothetical protein